MTSLTPTKNQSGSEFYNILRVDQVKCWTTLNLEDGGHLQFKRTQLNESLVDKLVEKRIEVVRARDPAGTLYIVAVYCHGTLLYPQNPKKDISELYRDGGK